MKNLFLLETHSFIDVITNSSTELFVSDTDKSEKMVFDILKETLKDLKSIYNRSENNHYHGLDDHVKIQNILTIRTMLGKDILKEYKGWGLNIPNKKKNYILIEGTDDNSIPYELQEAIADLFTNCRRYHLG